MRRHSRALGLLLTSAAVVAAGLVAAPAGSAGAVDPAPQVVYIDAAGHLMVGALDGSDTPRDLAPGLHAYDAYVSPSGSSVIASLTTGANLAGSGTHALVLRNRATSSTTILSTHGAWTAAPYDSGGGLFLDSRGGVYDASGGGVVTRRSILGPSAGAETGNWVEGMQVSPGWSHVAYRWSEDDCSNGIATLDLHYGTHTGFTSSSGDCAVSTEMVGWADWDTVLFSRRATASVAPADAVVYSLTMLPTVVGAPVDTGMRGITRVEHWGTEWWMWRAGGTEYGVSSSPTQEPAQWSPVPAGMTIVRTVASDPPVFGPVVNRAPSQAHVSIQPTTVNVGSSPSLLGFADYAVDPPGWTPDVDAGRYAYVTGTGVLYGSIDEGRTWKVLSRTDGRERFVVSPLTRNLWLKWRHPSDAFTTSSTSIVRKVTATPLIDGSVQTQLPGGATRIAGTVTRMNGTARLLRWTGSTWVQVATTSISSTGRFSFGWRTLRHGKYRVHVPATTYWGASSKTLYV